MTKKITETVERWCCQWDDFVPYPDSQKIDRGIYDRVHCKYCGQEHEYYSCMAGSRDWNYREVKG